MKAGLIGHGIGQSLTPAMHEAEGRALGFDYTYQRFDTGEAPWSGMSLPDILDHAEASGLAGVNVTHPHKTEVGTYLDHLEGPAQDLGTVNTVVFRDGKRIGHTTDYSGFREAMRRTGVALVGKPVAQFGAGGAGTATSLALLDEGADLSIVDVDLSRAEALVTRLKEVRPNAHVQAVSGGDIELKAVSGAVNATPLGMKSYPGMAFDPADLPDDAWVADIVYFPMNTALLQAARARGLQAFNGGGMALYQAVFAFELITGHTPDAERMADCFARLSAQG